ncbi:MAG: Hydrogenase maturation factor HypA [Eubacteriales bacterium]|jgi:hydrogenase nickel incorporation protein HypA/HybF
MHELPVVLDIIRVMDEEAEKNNMKKISKISLVIGELSSIIDESVQMYFEAAAKGHPCEDAELVFEHRPAMLRCQSCGKEFPHARDFQCPDCGGDSILIKGTGREFYILSFDGQ